MRSSARAPKSRPAKNRPAKTRPRSVRSHGPVECLEDHLPDEWWKGVFTELYLLTDGDVVENPENTRGDVDLLVGLAKIDPATRVLDLCCGQGRHSLELARRGIKVVTGIDQSAALLKVARARAKAERLDVRFLRSDARRLPLESGEVDCVALLGNSFGYFSRSEEDVAVLREVRRVLSRKGRVLLDLADGAHVRETFQPRSWEWIDRDHLVVRERQLSGDRRRLVCREVVLSTRRGVIADQFYAETLYSPSEVRALLSSVGFVDVTQHNAHAWSSTREQDLGMMAARMVVTASI